MPVDASIYFQQQTPDFLGNFQKGYSLGQAIKQNRQEDELRDAYKNAFTTDPNSGRVSLNPAAIGEIGKISPQKAFELQKLNSESDMTNLKANHEKLGMLGSLALGINDEASRQNAFQTAQKLGLDTSQLPQFYDQSTAPVFKRIGLSALTAQQRIENDAKNRGLDIQQQEADAKTSEASSSAKRAADAHADRVAGIQAKSDQKADDAYQKATKDINTFKGNSAVQTAASAVTNAKNALSLADKGNLSPDQIHLFASEMGKLATGGVPGQSEIDALVPHTAASQLAKVTQFFSNSPSDAEAQAFINNNKGYLKELLNNYGNVVDTYKYNMLDGYKKKLKPEDYQDLKTRIKAQSAVQSEPSSSSAIPAQSHPQASDALQWAKQNPNDPRAQAIMQRLGGQ